MEVVELAMVGFGLISTLMFWLFRTKDEARAKAIQTLFEKHDEDVEKLAQLKIIIAGNHYERRELDIKFEKLEYTFKEGFDTLGERFDKLSSILIEHVSKSK